MKKSKIIIVFLLFYTLNIYATNKTFYDFIPSNTFAFINNTNEDLTRSQINKIDSFSQNFKKALLISNTELEAKAGITLKEGLSFIYLSPSGITKAPTIIGKTTNASLLIKYFESFYKTEKSNYNNFHVYTLSLVQKQQESKNQNLTIKPEILYMANIDDYFVLSTSLLEIKIIADVYTEKKQSFALNTNFKEITDVFLSQKNDTRFYINIEEMLRIFEPIAKQGINVVLQSFLSGGGFTTTELKEISRANTEQLFSYLSQIKYFAGEYQKNGQHYKLWIKYTQKSPLFEQTKISPKELKLLSYLPEQNVLLAINKAESIESRQAYYNYIYQKLSRFDTFLISQKNFLSQFNENLKSYGDEEVWAWISSPEGLIWVNIVNIKNKHSKEILKNRFEGINLFFKSKQAWLSAKGEKTSFKQIEIENEKIIFSPATFNILELEGYTSKTPNYNVWYCYIENTLIMTIEDKPVVIKEIISNAKKEKKSLLQKNNMKNNKNNYILFFSPEIFSFYLNSNISENKSGSPLLSALTNKISIINEILKSQDFFLSGTSKNDGFLYEWNLVDKTKK